jgi:hypothetical protein
MSRNVQVRVEDELIDWFDKMFPAHGSKQWFVESCFLKLKEAVEKQAGPKPSEVPEITINEILKAS